MVLEPDQYPYDFREVVALCEISDTELAGLDPANRMAGGLMIRCADLLSAAETVVDRGHPDACGVLLRAVIDGVVTAFWLLADPEENLPKFLGEHLRNLERMVRWSGGDEARVQELEFYTEEFRSWGFKSVEGDMPGMGTRAASLWSEVRPLYKELSAELHATVRSVNLALTMRSTDDVVAKDPYLFAPQDWIAQAAYLTLALAKRLHDAHDWDGRIDVDELYEDLRDWQPNRRGT